MKKIRTLLTALVFTSFSLAASAQDITVAEPDSTTADLVYWVTPANELKALPFETGEIKEHKNKLGKIASIVGNAAGAAGALGGIGSVIGANSGSIGTVLSGISVMNTASNIGTLAEITDNLTGAEGHDFTYKGANSSLVVTPNGKDMKLILNIRFKNEDNDSKEAGITLFKVVRFKATKKDRRLRWFQSKAALINTDKSEDADKAGYLSFGFQNYGDHCSLLTIPASELEKGEYGVYFLGNMFAPNLAILCYTFSVQ